MEAILLYAKRTEEREAAKAGFFVVLLQNVCVVSVFCFLCHSLSMPNSLAKLKTIIVLLFLSSLENKIKSQRRGRKMDVLTIQNIIVPNPDTPHTTHHTHHTPHSTLHTPPLPGLLLITQEKMNHRIKTSLDPGHHQQSSNLTSNILR